MNETYVTIGAEMKKKREEAGISLRALAKALGYSAPYVLDLEAGRRTWYPSTEPKLEKVYLAALNRVKTAQGLIKRRKKAHVSVEQLAAEMKMSAEDLSVLERGRIKWKSGNIDYKKLYASALKKIASAESSVESQEENAMDNTRDLKIKQLILCLDGCSDDELNEIVNLAESKYLRHISDAEEREFYRETLEKIYKNNLPLNRDFIYT